ncbi:MAG TPA: hypothetical protein VIE65_13990 [Methylobacter sp.]
MTPKSVLDELERMDREATPGPWCEHPNGTSVWSGENYGDFEHDARHIFNTMQSGASAVRDTILIVAARNALPSLIASVRTLSALLETLPKCEGLDCRATATKEEHGGMCDGFNLRYWCDEHAEDGRHDGTMYDTDWAPIVRKLEK